jgi:membrane protein YdbS with pleckstrin-like domain
MRAFGLASVTVFTAGGRVEIPGLTPEDADAMRDRIAALAKIAKEDV